jgi:hypothetical protein
MTELKVWGVDSRLKLGAEDHVAWWPIPNVFTIGSLQATSRTVFNLVNNSLNLRSASIFQREKYKKYASYIRSNMVFKTNSVPINFNYILLFALQSAMSLTGNHSRVLEHLKRASCTVPRPIKIYPWHKCDTIMLQVTEQGKILHKNIRKYNED